MATQGVPWLQPRPLLQPATAYYCRTPLNTRARVAHVAEAAWRQQLARQTQIGSFQLCYLLPQPPLALKNPLVTIPWPAALVSSQYLPQSAFSWQRPKPGEAVDPSVDLAPVAHALANSVPSLRASTELMSSL